MRSKLLLVCFLVLLVFPSNVNATNASIKDFSIKGPANANIGDSVSVNVNINFSNLQSGASQHDGILFIAYDLNFDSNSLYLANATAKNFIIDDPGEDIPAIISNTVDIGNISENSCAEGLLYCGNYSGTIKFIVKNTTSSNLSISIESVVVGFITLEKLYQVNENMSEEELAALIQPIYTNNAQTYNLKINNPGTIINQELPEVNFGNNNSDSAAKIANSIPKNNNSKPQTETTPEKSNNAYLKTFTVEGYDIHFDQEQQNYSVYIDKDVNQLKLNIALADEKASFVINGADDLKASNYTTTVVVTAESGNQLTYTIKSKFKTEEEEVVEEDNSVSIIKFFKNNKKPIIIGASIIGGIILLGLIVVIIRKIKDRKLDNLFKDFE